MVWRFMKLKDEISDIIGRPILHILRQILKMYEYKNKESTE